MTSLLSKSQSNYIKILQGSEFAIYCENQGFSGMELYARESKANK